MPTHLKHNLLVLLVSFSVAQAAFAQTGAAGSPSNSTGANSAGSDVGTTPNTTSTDDQALVKNSEEKSAEKTEFGEVTGTQKYKITCTNGSDVREITVITQEDNSTGVVYKKFDTVKTMAVAKTDPAYADQVAEKIKGNLETAGFTCAKE